MFRNDPDKAIEHFVNCDMSEGRQASPDFNIIVYAFNNPDLFNAFLFNIPEYYIHYITYGKAEGRIAS